MMPAYGRTSATTATAATSCSPSYMGFGSDILTGLATNGSTTLLGLEFYTLNLSVCLSMDGTLCSGNNNSWMNNGTTYHVRTELDTISGIFNAWLCAVGSGTCSSGNISALSDLSSAYAGAVPKIVTSTLTAQNLIDLQSFYVGFTTSQHDTSKKNQQVVQLSGFKFDLYP
jgi:hypothetical protein